MPTGFPRRSVGASALAGALLALTGCTAYEAKPVSPATFPAQLAARALPPHAGAWSQADLLAVAMANSPQVAEARAKFATAVAAAKVSRQALPALLTLTAEYSKQAGGDTPWLYGFTSDFPLNAGVRRSARDTAADLAVLQARYDYGEALWTVRTALAKAVAQAAVGDQEVTLATQDVASRQDRHDRLARRVEAGEDDRTIALLAQTDLFAAQRRLSDAQARQAQARVALAQALGLSSAALAGMTIESPTATASGTEVSGWRDEAALSRRDVLRAVADYDLAENALRLEVAKQYPELHLGPGYTWERGVNKVPFSLGLGLPPYDLNKANIAQAEAKRAEAGHTLETTQATVLAGVDQADAALTAARRVTAQVEGRDLPTARRTLDLAQRSAQAGETDRAEQAGAQAAGTETELSLLDARRTAALAKVDLEDALRRAFDPRENDLLKAQMAAGEPR